MKQEKVSIIIPAYRASKTIGKVLDALKNQDYPSFEVIVVDDAPFDPCGKEVKKFKKVTYAPNEKNMGLSRSINKGIKLSSGSIVLTLHDDCVPTKKTWLTNLVKVLKDDSVGVVTSDVVIDFDKLTNVNKIFAYVYGLGQDMKFTKSHGTQDVYHIGDKGDAFKKSFLASVGGFDETYSTAGEDTDLSNKILKAGKRIVLTYEAKIEHIFSETERQASYSTHLKKAFQYTGQTIHSFLRYGTNYKLDMALAIIYSILSIFINPLIIFLMLIPSVLLHRVFFAYSVLASFALILSNMPLWIGFISYFVVKNAYRSLKYIMEQKSITLAIPIFIFGAAWDFLAGIGWIKGTLKFIKEKFF